MDTERIQLAEALLQEAVYRSRAAQAAGVGLAGGMLDREPEPGGCGLGKEAAIELDLTPRGAELFASLWPEPRTQQELQHLRDEMAKWVQRQDALDRKRNHFLRDFRRDHGNDRNAYSDDERSAFEAGIERVNAEESQARRAAATKLLNT